MVKSRVHWFISRMSLSSISSSLLLLFVAFLVLFPLVMIIYGSFNSGSPMRPGVFTTDGYIALLTQGPSWNVIWVTIWLAAVRTALSVGIAVVFAWMVARVDTPAKKLVQAMIISRLWFPALSFILVWIMLLAPRSGLINVFMMNLFHLQNPLFDVYSFGGMIFVSTLASVPVWFLMLVPVFANMDASLEESSRMSGANNFITFFRVTLPLAAPSIVGVVTLSMVHWLESLDVELILGVPAGIYVISSKIYTLVNQTFPPNYTFAMAYSVLLLGAMFVLILVYQRVFLARSYKYATVTGRGYTVRPIKIGRWKYVIFSLIVLYFVLSTALPMVFILIASFMKVFPSFAGSWFTFDNWRVVLTNPAIWGYWRNTFVLGVGTGTAGMFLYALMSYLALRTRYKGRWLVEFMSWIPYALPGVVLALGLLWVYVGTVRLPFPMYGTIHLLILCCIIKRMPIGVRVTNSAILQISKELEDASRIHGGSWWYTFKHTYLPLMWPSLVSGWLLIAVLSVKELAIVLMLYGPKSATLSVYFFLLIQEAQLSHYSVAMVVGILELTGIGVLWILSQLATRWGRGAQARAA